MFRSERFDFRNANGDLLTGRLEMPSRARAFAIFSHCFTCSKNVKAATKISRGLSAHGIAVLRFDFTGLGNSEGDFSNTHFSSNVSDLLAAAAALRDRHEAPQLLVGHSLGGTAALMVANKIPEVRAVATLGSPAEPSHVTHLFADQIEAIERAGQAEVNLAGRDFTLRKAFIDDVRSINLSEVLANLRKAVLIYHSPKDAIVNIGQARLIYNALRHPKSFLSLDGADHMLSQQVDVDYVSATLAAWSQRYLKLNDVDGELPPEGIVRLEEIDGFTQRISTAAHEIIADEPKSVGGNNLGMTPYDLLLASLGACTSMTLRMYANHKGLPLEQISVDLEHDRIHAQDCEDCLTSDRKIDRIRRVIHIQGQLTEAQIRRLEEIADRCPVHKTLMNEKQIPTEIKVNEPVA